MIQKDKETVSAQTEAVKASVENTLKLKSVNVDILSARNAVGEFGFITPFKLRRNKQDGEFERFSQTLDQTVNDKFVTAVKVIIKDTHNTRLDTLMIEKYNQEIVEGKVIVPDNKQPAPKQASIDNSGINDFATQFLGLMGIDANNVRDAKGALYNAALCFNQQKMERDFNDKMRDKDLDYERKDNERRIDELTRRASAAEARAKDLERDNGKLERKIESLENELERASEAYKDLQKVNPSNVAFGSLLGVAGQYLLQRNAVGLGRALGFDGATLAGILNQSQEQDATPDVPNIPIPNVSVTPEDERTPYIEEVCEAMRAMSDKDFTQTYKSVIAFAKKATATSTDKTQVTPEN